jgi:hypothetical protein
MISTVTTSTVSTVTIAGSVAIIGIIILLFLLIQKELSSASNNERAIRLSKLLNIGIAPLLIAFVLIVVSKVAAILK